MKQLGPNIKKYPGYLLCTTYLEFLPALNYPPLPKKNEWKFEIFFTLIFIHTLTTEQDFEFLLQSGVSIVCSGSSIGLFQAYYIPTFSSKSSSFEKYSFIHLSPSCCLLRLLWSNQIFHSFIWKIFWTF